LRGGRGEAGAGVCIDAGGIDAGGDEWPAVVAAGLDEIEFVAADGAVLGGPEFPGDGVITQALHVAMAVTPDRAEGIGSVDERVVGRDAAIGGDAEDFTERAGEVLGLGRVSAIADGEKEMAGGIEEKAATVVRGVGGVEFGVGAENSFLVGPAVFPDAAADDDGHGGALDGAGFGVSEIDPAVVREIGVGDEVEQTAVLFDEDLREAGDRRGEAPVCQGDRDG
jgi:hypothetical protein